MPTSTELANQIEAMFGGRVQPIQGVDRGFFPALKAGFLEETVGLGRPKTFEAETATEHIGKFIGEVIPETALLTGTIAALPIGGIAGGAASFAIVNTIQEAIRQSRDEDEQSFAQELGEVAKSGGTGALLGGGLGFAGRALAPVGRVVGRKVLGRPIKEVAEKVTETNPLLIRLAKAIRTSKGKTIETEKLITKQKAGRFIAGRAVIEKELERGNPIGALRGVQKAFAGEFKRAELNIAKKFTTAEQDVIKGLAIERAGIEDPSIVLRLGTALEKKLFSDVVPQRNEIALLSQYLGEDVGKALIQKLPFGQRLFEGVLNVAGLPRALLASFDMSAPLRQGVMLAPSNPVIWGRSFGRMFKAFFSEKQALKTEQMILTKGFPTLRKQAGLDLTKRAGTTAELAAREEPYMSSLIQEIPGLRSSERAYVTFLNSLRAQKFDAVAKKWIEKGITFKDNPIPFKRLARYVNAATGRGALPKSLTGVAPILNATMFSPRLLFGRIQAPLSLLTKEPELRKIVARDLVSFVTAGVGLLGLANEFIPNSTVETDPRSTDFGKVKVGDTRVDIWGGYQQLARTLTQMLLQERKASTTGRISEVGRLRTIGTFFQSKASPAMGLVIDFMRGEDFLGRKVPSLTDLARLEPEAKEAAREQTFQRLAPLVFQDIVDALRFQGYTAASLAAPAFFGFGAQTYEPNSFTKSIRTKNLIANETFGMEWDKLTPRQQIVLKRENESILKLEQAAKVERTGFFGLEASIERQLEIGKDVQGQLDKPIQTELKNLNVTIGGLSRSIGTGVKKGGKFFLNDERYARYQRLVKQNINRILGSLIKRKQWAKVPTARKQEALKKVISRAKAISRKLLVREIETKK